MKYHTCAIAILGSTLCSAPLWADDNGTYDAAAGEEIYMGSCRACHGPTGKGVSSYPNLVEHPAEYLTDKLERYRAGERFGPNTMLMAPQAKDLSDEDIGNLVAFITSIPQE